MRSSLELEDVPKLMQHIQRRLPVKEAARTSILSKSWLHAWSTIPTLRFDFRDMKLVDMERTLIRYLRDNIQIKSFDLMFHIKNQDQESASFAETCIRTVLATNTNTNACFEELSLLLDLDGAVVNLPYEILSAENLTKIRVKITPELKTRAWLVRHRRVKNNRVSLRQPTHHPVIIKCVFIQELYLESVQISQELLDGILCSCGLLGKIELLYCSEDLSTIKVKHLHFLYDLRIVTEDKGTTTLEIDDVPNLVLFNFTCHLLGHYPVIPFNAHSMSFGRNLRELSLGGAFTDNESLEKFLSGFHFLESLTLLSVSTKLPAICFTCPSIKRLSLLDCPCTLFEVKVNAPNLLFLTVGAYNRIPSLLFPGSTTLKQVTFRLKLVRPPDTSSFLKMREALTLSCEFYHFHITAIYVGQPDGNQPLDVDIDDLKRRLPFPPAKNVQHLSFETDQDKCLWERSEFFDAFFEIFHPDRVFAMRDVTFRRKNHLCKVLLNEVSEKTTTTTTTTTASWPCYLKHVQIRHHQKWETLTDSHISFLHGSDVLFNLNWG